MAMTIQGNLPSLLFLILFILVLSIIFKYLHDKFSKNPKSVAFAATIPGPPSLPLLGNGLDFFIAGPNVLNKILEYTEKYGPIFRLWFGKHLVIGLSDIEDLKMVFQNSKMMGKPAIFEPFRDFWGDGLFTSPTNIWKKTRKLHQPAFTNRVLPYYVPEFNNKIYNAVEIMNKLVDGPEVDMGDYLPYISFDIIAKTALDIEVDTHDKNVLEFHKCIRIAFETSILRMFRPWLHIKPICDLVFGKTITDVRRKMLQFAEQVIEIKLDQIHKETQNTSRDDEANMPVSSTIKPFLMAAYHSQFVTGSKTILRDEVMTILTGGTETTGTANSFCLMAIAANPDIQDKLYDEIYEVFGISDRPADANDVSRLPYLDQVVKETLRRYPVGPVIFKNVDEDSKIGSRIFPAGTTLLISVIGIHMNPKYYPNPLKFNPENFSPDAVDKRPKLAFLTFGAGARNCIGMNYAILEMKLTIIALLRTFRFHTTVKLEDLKLKMGLSIGSVDGYKMSIKLRDRRPSYVRDENKPTSS